MWSPRGEDSSCSHAQAVPIGHPQCPDGLQGLGSPEAQVQPTPYPPHYSRQKPGIPAASLHLPSRPPPAQRAHRGIRGTKLTLTAAPSLVSGMSATPGAAVVRGPVSPGVPHPWPSEQAPAPHPSVHTHSQESRTHRKQEQTVPDSATVQGEESESVPGDSAQLYPPTSRAAGDPELRARFHQSFTPSPAPVNPSGLQEMTPGRQPAPLHPHPCRLAILQAVQQKQTPNPSPSCSFVPSTGAWEESCASCCPN